MILERMEWMDGGVGGIVVAWEAVEVVGVVVVVGGGAQEGP